MTKKFHKKDRLKYLANRNVSVSEASIILAHLGRSVLVSIRVLGFLATAITITPRAAAIYIFSQLNFLLFRNLRAAIFFSGVSYGYSSRNPSRKLRESLRSVLVNFLHLASLLFLIIHPFASQQPFSNPPFASQHVQGGPHTSHILLPPATIGVPKPNCKEKYNGLNHVSIWSSRERKCPGLR